MARKRKQRRQQDQQSAVATVPAGVGSGEDKKALHARGIDEHMDLESMIPVGNPTLHYYNSPVYGPLISGGGGLGAGGPAPGWPGPECYLDSSIPGPVPLPP